MTYQFHQSGESGQLNLSGELTVQYASELLTALAEAQNNVTDLVINLADATEVDVSCLQLLCAAHRSAVCAQKSIALRHASREFRRALEDTGYIRHMGCSQDTGQNCLWLA